MWHTTAPGFLVLWPFSCRSCWMLRQVKPRRLIACCLDALLSFGVTPISPPERPLKTWRGYLSDGAGKSKGAILSHSKRARTAQRHEAPYAQPNPIAPKYMTSLPMPLPWGGGRGRIIWRVTWQQQG
ncbi:hypothetical protein H4582DRAFT_1923919 [Lactarius indigo]|nr:hypothetical protein H4582DRAFT_1923919 [Lactarius indigo]